MNKYRMTHLYNDVHKFNSIAGVFEGHLDKAANLYLSLIFEELSETIDAFENDDSVELVDGCADILVTAFGLAQVLEKAGFDVEKAVKKVAANNLSKFPSADRYPFKLPDDSYTQNINKEFNVVVLKNSVGKIMKPSGFQPVDLSDCVPNEFFDVDYM